MRVLAAMSGGVDSAVAAARAVDAGHEVVGVHLALARNPDTLRAGARGCCTIEDAGDARRVADLLGIPFYVWDLAERFEQDVIDDFVAEYRAGRTPNPCVRCNQKIKFAALLDKAVALGFDAVSTGHYAQLLDGPHGRELHRAIDPGKDQSYVLAVLSPQRLARSMFPLGDTRKEDVRAEAARRGLRVAAKPDSHDICCISDGDTQGFLARKLGEQPGPIVDTDGQQLGEHSGAYGFTVGQRRGLSIGRPAADGRPRYVLSIEPVSNTVVVGSAQELAVSAISGVEATWCAPVPGPQEDLHVQVRAHGAAVPARLVCADPGAEGAPSSVEVELLEPISGVAAGQTLVLYRGTQVVGSATISAAHRPAAVPVEHG